MKIVSMMSGGLDSICYTASYLEGNELSAMMFDYGQKAGSKELEAARLILEPRGVECNQIDVRSLGLLWSGTQLTDDKIAVEGQYTPSVVVPLRNAVFLTIAVSRAYTIGARMVLIGSHLDDSIVSPITNRPMYPDCSLPFLCMMQDTLRIGHYRSKVEIWSPARESMTKTDNLRRGYEVLGDDVFKTWSCYLSNDKQCGVCESCLNRKSAFQLLSIKDMTEYKQ
jgi:7-cyano-7-deazaguanine synthase